MIALLFGGSYLASSILLQAFSDGDENNVLGQLIALAVMVVPLFLVPSLLKGSLDAIPIVGGFANKLASRANGLVGKEAKSGFTKSTFGRSLGIRRQAKENYRSKKFAEGVSKQGSLANILAKEPGILPSQRAANKAVDRTAIAAADKADGEEVAAAEALFRTRIKNPSDVIGSAGTELEDAVVKGDDVRARAAQNVLLKSGGKGLDQLHKSLTKSFGTGPDAVNKNSPVGESIRTALNAAGLKSKNNALASWAYDKSNIEETTDSRATYGGLSDIELAGHGKASLEKAYYSRALTPERAKQMLGSESAVAAMGQDERLFVEAVSKMPENPIGPVNKAPGS
jgi:hypothetical protein